MIVELDGVAGVDEAGRGPLAGPVAAAAVILDPARVPPGLADSKTLSEARREALFAEIVSSARAVAVAFAPVGEIDAVNIRGATLAAMARAVAALAVPPRLVLVDGRDVPRGVSAPARAIVGGDGLHPAISAASIVAKVVRDRAMRDLDAAFPGYGFAKHKGYGSAAHLEALARLGPCAAHRARFAPVAAAVARAGGAS
jgi:ribonuclease HII